MAEFTVQEMVELFGRSQAPLTFSWVAGSWTVYKSGKVFSRGTTPDELRSALKERAVPTAEEAEVALHSLPVNVGSDTVRLLTRFIEAHREQPDV